MSIDKVMNRREQRQIPLIRPGQLSVRKQRIERWAYKGRNDSSNDKAIRSSALLGSSLIEKKSESSFIQEDRRLNMDLYQLGQQREKLLKQHNFDQKLFAAKQAIRHKDNDDFQRLEIRSIKISICFSQKLF
jgi:siderophore synthetase component